MSEAYLDFLKAKACIAVARGIEVSDAEINPILLPHQRIMVRWALRLGRAGLFAAFGLGKTFMQIEFCRLLVENLGESALIVIPLGVRQEFIRDARVLATAEHPRIPAETKAAHAAWIAGRPDRLPALAFIRSVAEASTRGIYLTNYETIRDGKLDPRAFGAASLDEASCLRGFGGSKTFREFMKFFDGVRFKLVATATPSPNEYIELLAYSAFLEVMDVGEAKTRFFKRNSEKADSLTIHPHKAKEFWLWVASWALFVQRPSDLCECSCHRGRKFSASASAGSKSSSGFQAGSGMVLGAVDATAGARGSQHLITCSQVETPVAAASAPATARNQQPHTALGGACSIGSIEIGETTVSVGSSSASAGDPSSTSSTIWASHPQAVQSSGSTTIADTSPETAAGLAAKSRPETPAERCESPTAGASNPSPLGPKSSASTIGSSIHDISSAGHPSGCSETSCAQCRALDSGYDLPPLSVHFHTVASDLATRETERDGQGILLAHGALGVVGASREKRSSLPLRIAKLREILDAAPAEHFIIWHDLEDERRAIEAAVPSARSVYGSQELTAREETIIGFSDGAFQYLAAKPVIAGSGCNFQRHCHRAVFLGIGFKFNDFVQAIHRIQRFQQERPVEIHIIASEGEQAVLRTLLTKWKQHQHMVDQMSQIIREYGLNEQALAASLSRSIGVERIEMRGPNHRIVNNDTVLESAALPENSLGLIVTSIPFSTQYEYTPSYNDFGHTDSDPHFWAQMDFLTPSLLRALMPGRNCVIHVKDRIIPGGINGLGFQTVSTFHCDAIQHFRRHGFAFLGMKTVTTDVVRENNQTYRLGWSEQCKDGSKMGAGLPEYLLIFRKHQTDRSVSYADTKVVKAKKWFGSAEREAGDDLVGEDDAGEGQWINPQGYSRARWQIDAHGYLRSSGDRALKAEDLLGQPADVIYKMWKRFNLGAVYDFEYHVAIAEALETRGRLPPTFMLLPPHSPDEAVWSDVTRMRTLNGVQQAKGKEMHLCPLQFDIVDRVIAQMSMPGETVFDPFGGLMTVPYRAILQGRFGVGVELNPGYFLDGALHCAAAEEKVAVPSLFDLMDAERPALQAAE